MPLNKDSEEFMRRAEAAWENQEGAFFDVARKAADKLVKTVQTQHAIIKYAEQMAIFLAEAGRSSGQATGDSPHEAVDKWLEVIRKRAHELLRYTPANQKSIEDKPLEHDE